MDKAASSILRRRPELRRLSKTALARELVSKVPDADHPFRTRRQFDDWFASSATASRLPTQLAQVSRQGQQKVHISRRIAYPPYSFQIDVTIVRPKSPVSRRDRFLLMVEVNSRKAFAEVLSGNTASETTDAYERLMHNRILPEIPLFEGEDNSLKGRLEHVWVVVGDAFFDNAAFKRLNDDWHVLTSTVVA